MCFLNKPFLHQSTLTEQLQSMEIFSFAEAINHVRLLPYGRNTHRDQFIEVLTEGQGTCSTKHGMLKQLALDQEFDQVDLILCIYRMTSENTTGIGSVLQDNQLKFIPEAHCFIQIGGEYSDCTNEHSSMDKIKKDILLTQKIKPSFLGDEKIVFHKKYLQSWIEKDRLPFTLDQLWTIREKCIGNLAK